ncbi:hypothetical protein C8J45_103323 [Sphingomonas sp. PP-CE-3G-477]|uniref:hypothetical protein n=1 Tax=Sphingomonas sp. PP-CE-3G-477 TaxID=2135660 RepID=UPI000D3D8C61|nr:hypothetical protein [Sphingomonas sp. PP-CE-3G-477]PTQ64473.1 hypothetical protein C8J45_103323 [Sphingomonas sp. PP-CE-3G-477]
MTTQGTEARRGETAGLDAKRDGPVGAADAPQTTDNRENIVTTSEQQAVPVAQEQESALATAFYLLDTLAGEGLSQTCDDGRTIEADDTVHALCSAFYMEPDVGWYRDLAAELAPASLPCKSGEGAGEDKGNHDCLAKRRPGEPMFILLGRDPDAWQIVRAWAARRLNAGGDPEHSLQGMKTANAMREYAADPANRPVSAPDASVYPRLDATQTREAELVAYLVWSNEHKAWWGKDRCGYTKIIANAGRYNRAEALAIAGTRDGGWQLNKGNPDEIAIPEADAVDQYAEITAAQLNARGGA